MLKVDDLKSQYKSAFSSIISNGLEAYKLNSFPVKSELGDKEAENFAKTFDELFSEDYTNSLANIVGNGQLKNTILSDKYGIDIYELNGEKFYMLVKSMNPITEKTNILETNQKNYSIERGCYSLIGSDNIDVYNKQFVYGFVNGFIPENIISVFETDCFSRESDEPILNEDYGTTAVNRLMTPDQIVNGLDSNKKTRYSEIQIAGKINPDFIVTFDEINELAVSESKRLNIPIVVINTKKYENNKKRSNPFNNENLQYIDFSGSRESNLRRSR